MTRRISIFGATGSIGCNTVDLITRNPDAYEVIALTGARNIALLAKQAISLRAKVAVTAVPDLLQDLRDALAGHDIRAMAGPEALLEAAAMPADWIMSAIVGAAGLAPTLEAAKHGTTLALANKESLVCAGDLLNATVTKAGGQLLPVDSEHSAVFQALKGETRAELDRVILTASGGPFRDWPLERIAKATLAEAVAHPNWDMGQRISVDSASMFNKALEVIEAKYLFDLSPDQVEVVVHPQSIIHSMINLCDNSVIAQLGVPDMRGAIGYALHYPARQPLPVERLNLSKIGSLTFHAPDTDRFPALRLAQQVMKTGGMAGAAFNAAKEAALDAFIAGEVGFLDMAVLVETCLTNMPDLGAQSTADAGLAAVLRVDHAARENVRNQISRAA